MRWRMRADVQSLAYGQCIGKSYQEVQKGMCENEFKAFKECVQVSHPIYFIFTLRREEVRADNRNHSDGNGKPKSTVVQYHHTMHSI